MIVADTNIISYLFINGEFSNLAENAYQKDPDWAAPLLWRSEFRSVMALCLRKDILAMEDALQIAAQAESLMQNHEYIINSSTIMRLVLQSDCSAYDCEFVALAQNLAVPLVTMDKKILKNFPTIAVRLDRFVSSR